MSLNTVLRSDVRNVLTAIRVASMDSATSAGSCPESAAFQQGYQAALDAVALALDLRLPPPQAPRERGLNQSPMMYLQPPYHSAEGN
jgi:hypothetical protein